MSLDSRGYYYRSQRVGGLPRRIYVGSGYVAELAAALDAAEQAERAQQDAQRRLQRAKDRASDKEVDAEYHRLREGVAALLTAAGYYQHHRGEWRKMGKRAAELTGPTNTEQPNFRELVARADAPDAPRADLVALELALVAQDDDGVTCAIEGGAILNQIIEAAAVGVATRIVIKADAIRYSRELGRETCPPFERKLVDHAVLCWVRLQICELAYTQSIGGKHTQESALYWDRRLEAAQRRYMRAMHHLAKVRGMMPTLQLNLAHQQIVNTR